MRLVLFGLLLVVSSFAKAQLPIGTLIDHKSLLMQGYDSETKKVQLFDPEKKFSSRGSDRFIEIDATYYRKEPYVLVSIGQRVVNNVLLHSGISDGFKARDNCVPNPALDKLWGSGSFANAVNAAIANEKIEFSENGIGAYVHPSYSNLYEQSENIIAALRSAYQQGYAGLNVTYIGTDATLNDISQDFCCKMDICDEFNHQSTCLGNVVPRLEAGIGTNNCWSSLAESLGATWGFPDEATAMLHTIYNFLYFDVACCNNSHREAFLNCDFTVNTRHGFGSHYTIDNDPYELLMAWDFVTLTFNTGCTWNTEIGTPVCQSVPLDLISFDVDMKNCESVEIKWETTNESNIEQYEIYRSGANSPRVKIADVLANNYVGNNLYSYTDFNPALGLNYYELQHVDLDGRYGRDAISKIENTCTESKKIKAFPNPVYDRMIIDRDVNILYIRILDSYGKVITKQLPSPEYDLTSLVPGFYVLEIHTYHGVEYLKIIKK